MTKAELTPERVAIRGLMTRFLVGSGLELGPGHVPFPLPYPGATAQYVDRWEPKHNRELFPELGNDAPFPEPHIVANFDTDRLAGVGDGTQDFVIASHVLEHLANPLALLLDIHRVLRLGGVALILLPDRRRTFDSTREATPLQHLVEEYELNVTHVSDSHVEDFLRHVDGWDGSLGDAERQELFDRHRQRSIHVHCWTQDEFVPVLEHTIVGMGMSWEALDACFVESSVDGFEFGFALRRGPATVDPGQCAERLRLVIAALGHRTLSLHAAPQQQLIDEVHARQRAEAERQAAQQRAAEAEARLEAIRRLPGYPVLRSVWRAQRRLRGHLTGR